MGPPRRQGYLPALDFRPRGTLGAVRAVDFSPDGRMAVSGGLGGKSITSPGELILWDLGSGTEIRQFTGHINGVVDAHFTPDGQKILSSSGDMEMVINDETVAGQVSTHDLLLWEVATGKILRRYDGLQQDVYALAIRPDGQQALLTSYYNNAIDVLDLNSGQIIQALTGHNNAVRSVSYLPDAQQALSASDDGSLIFVDWQMGSLRHFFGPQIANKSVLLSNPMAAKRSR